MRDRGVNNLYVYDYGTTRMPLPSMYKFLKHEHARSLLETGELRIGTLYDFRKVEAYGKKRGDAKEGTLSVRLDHALIEHEPDSQQAKFLDGLCALDMCCDSVAHNITRNESSKNCFVFCLTKSNSVELSKCFGDVNLEVVDALKLLEIIYCELKKSHSIGCFDIADCIYRDRQMSYGEDWTIPPLLIKDTKYAMQQEIRFFFESSDSLPEGIIIRNERLKECFRRAPLFPNP